MLSRIIELSVRNRVLVLLLFLLLIGGGIWTLLRIPVDAFPDTTPVQVQINTVAPALNGEEIEQQATLLVELAIGGLPGLIDVRSVSKFGLSQVVATFDDSTSITDARQYVSERLAGVELPEGIERPQLGPISTGLGEVFHYVKFKAKDETPAVWKAKAPTYNNLMSWIPMLRDQQIADIPIVAASIDPCIACMDRVIIVDRNSKEKKILTKEELLARS